MKAKWYYSHDGVTHGPFSEEEINDLVARKLLLASDLIWPEDRDRKQAAPASAIFDFSQTASPDSPLPDWLADVVQTESKGPLAEPLPSNEIPEWLDDLRLWLGLEVYLPAAPTTESAPSKPGQAGEVPDWLQGWQTPEKTTASPAPSATITIAVAAPSPAILPSPAESKPAAQKPVNPLVEKIRDVSGFDLETGQILDPEKFAKWKQEQAQSSTAGHTTVSNATLLEVFRKARLAIEAWVDADLNHLCIMQTEIEAIKSLPAIQGILREYANYGQAIQQKLLRHLEFMVENRRKYYSAGGKQTGRESLARKSKPNAFGLYDMQGNACKHSPNRHS